MSEAAILSSAADALEFMFGGKARFTMVSKASGKRYTYRMAKAKDKDMFFASLLVGQNNEADYEYIGFVGEGRHRLLAGKKGSASHPAFVGLDWALAQFNKGQMPQALEVWHEGRCARCARLLTDPASIARGFGPECAGKQ